MIAGGIGMSERKPITVYLAGDSTVQTYSAEHAPQAGWGQFIANYFTDDVRFHNHAIGGRSSRTFVKEGRLQTILEAIGEGDYLFVQMGHNDSTAFKPERYTDPYTEYPRYLKMYIDGAREKKAIPLLITPAGRLHWEEGQFLNSFPDYCRSMKQLADREQVLLIDLMERSLQTFAAIGYDEAAKWFMVSVNGTDHTHFTETGAKGMAKLVAEGVKQLNIDLSAYVTI